MSDHSVYSSSLDDSTFFEGAISSSEPHDGIGKYFQSDDGPFHDSQRCSYAFKETKNLDFLYQCNDLFCSEYASGVYDYLRQREGLFLPIADYINKLQPDLSPNMREILMHWLVEVAEEYEVTLETLLLAKNYIDRYLSKKQIRREYLQLLGITALLIASKYEVSVIFYISLLCSFTK